MSIAIGEPARSRREVGAHLGKQHPGLGDLDGVAHPERRPRVDPDQPAHPPREAPRGEGDHAAAERVTDEDQRVHGHGLDHGDDVIGEARDGPARAVATGAAMSGQIDPHHGVCRREGRELSVPVAPPTRPAVHEQQGRLAATAHIESDRDPVGGGGPSLVGFHCAVRPSRTTRARARSAPRRRASTRGA
jgi:hypothetical protein